MLDQVSIRRSHKARYLRINLLENGLAELVVPRGVSLKDANRFLVDKQSWIERHCRQHKPLTPPNEISLDYLGKTWQLRYQPDHHYSRLMEIDSQLMLPFTKDKIDFTQKVILQWLKKKAWLHLPQQINALAKQCQLPFNELSIRVQKTCWGSCNSKKNISLNAKLLLFPVEVAQYIIIHELCHTVYMNHSKKFWKLVESFLPGYRQQLNVLAQSREIIPKWLC